MSMPEAIIQAYPIANAPLDAHRWWMTSRGAQRMVIEYCKYLAILAREAILSLGPREAPPATNSAAEAPTPVIAAPPSNAAPAMMRSPE